MPCPYPYPSRQVDVVFLLDLLLQFILIYPEEGGRLEGPRWVEQPRLIVGHYLRTWFLPDLLSVAASAFDIASIQAGSSSSSNEPSDLKSFQAVRMVRTFRLIKLIRLVRLCPSLLSAA